MMQIDVDLVQLLVLPISLNLKKKTIINVLDKNIFIFVLIDRQFKKNCDCRIMMISNTVFILKHMQIGRAHV